MFIVNAVLKTCLQRNRDMYIYNVITKNTHTHTHTHTQGREWRAHDANPVIKMVVRKIGVQAGKVSVPLLSYSILIPRSTWARGAYLSHVLVRMSQRQEVVWMVKEDRVPFPAPRKSGERRARETHCHRSGLPLGRACPREWPS